ncbi:hypothetical protein A2U01_0000245, partial [Trifolium medium]|nr:hypothetical protein [Trifolium medium]
MTRTNSDKLDDLAAALSAFEASITTKLDAVTDRVVSLERSSPASVQSQPAVNTPSETATQTHKPPHLKLEVPRFQGNDPHGWIFKISQFFEYHQTPEEERITVASFYLDGPALGWYQWLYRNGQIVSWHQFLHALELRFAPTAYDDPRGKLFKLQQSTSVANYLNEFETLANRIVGLSPPDLLSCFISGLKPEIRREVLAHQPRDLSQAAGLARLHEEKLQDLLKLTRPKSPFPPWSNYSSSSASRPPTSPRAAPEVPGNKTSPPLLPTPSPKTRFRQLSATELTERREKGLCFNCDERFSRNHRCKARFLLLIAEDDESDNTEVHEAETEVLEPLPDPLLAWFGLPGEANSAQLSYHAMSGTQTAQTIRVVGRVEPHTIHVLVDGGSTLNFIQSQVARKLGLAHSPSPTLKVIVGNGEELLSNHVCKGVPIEIQGHKFEVDLYTLALSGPDVVLGTPWLKTLGPVLMDYGTLTMKFTHAQQPVELKGEQGPITSSISYHQLKRLVQQEPTAQIFSLSIANSLPTPPQAITHHNHKINRLLQRYAPLFEEPTRLPPPRFTDHSIPLAPDAAPVNVRPYRYPHAQKLEIELQVQKLLQNGWIQPSNSPFSSPVLLLKKKDGSWRMFVDYRALNVVTIKDRFPLPTVDELLDELGS